MGFSLGGKKKKFILLLSKNLPETSHEIDEKFEQKALSSKQFKANRSFRMEIPRQLITVIQQCRQGSCRPYIKCPQRACQWLNQNCHFHILVLPESISGRRE